MRWRAPGPGRRKRSSTWGLWETAPRSTRSRSPDTRRRTDIGPARRGEGRSVAGSRRPFGGQPARDPLLLVIRGPLGVGKTTIARAVARRLNAGYVSIDRILDDHRLIRWRRGRIALVSFRRANSVALRSIAGARGADRSVVLDGNFYYIGQIRDLVRRAPGRPRFFDLRAPLALCIARDAARRRSYGAQATRTVYRMNARYPFGEPINAARSKSRIVEEILRRIRVPPPRG